MVLNEWEGVNPLDLMPSRLSFGKPHVFGNARLADANSTNSLRGQTNIQRYAGLLAQEQFFDVPLALDFTLSVSDPKPLRVGGVIPSPAEQLESIYYGQRTDQGFNLLGTTVALPRFLGSIVRTHMSADLVYRYRNEDPGFRRDFDGWLLNQLHPGYSALIDSEVPPSGLDTPDFNNPIPGDNGMAPGALRGHFPPVYNIISTEDDRGWFFEESET